MLNSRAVGIAFALAVLTTTVAGHGNHAKRQTTRQALNTQPYNSLPNPGGPILYYNGTGDVPSYQGTSPVPAAFTPYTDTSTLENYFFSEIVAITSNSSIFNTSCSKCIATTEVLHLAAITQPVTTLTNLFIRYCNLTGFSIYASTCHGEFSPFPENPSPYHSDAGGIGPWWAQLYAKMSMATGDMQAWCHYNFDVCDAPAVIEINESQYFKPKPASAMVAPAPSGQNLNVLHLSDWHLDPRYDVGSEANCSQYLCCRPYATNTHLNTTALNPSVPASRFGYLYCDSPPDLALSSFASMGQFFNKSSVAFTIFTGDIVSHDNDDQLSREYVEYEERVTYETFKAAMGSSPIYPSLGNHDSLPEAYNTPNNINNGTGQDNAFSWNYELLSTLWLEDGWINSTEARYASTHYGAYAHTTKYGLRIISINTDFWYVANIYNYYNFTNPDNSGILAWVASELTACEARGQRAWIIGHVLSGYDGSQSLPNPSALFQSIVRRFSPATIAGVFFGHTHEDQIQIFYDYASTSTTNRSTLRNTTDVDYTKPLQVGYIGPSITPLTGNNAGYQLYQVDAKTFSIMGVQTYFANMSESLTWTTPKWQFEYDVRTTYNVPAINWPKTAPLNATFFDRLTQQMLVNQSLVERYNLYEKKSSVVTKNCSSKACAKQKVCYIRSGSSAIGRKCGSGNGPF